VALEAKIKIGSPFSRQFNIEQMVDDVLSKKL